MKAIGHIDELGGDPQFVAGFAHTAFQHRVDVQLLADFAKDVLLIPALESEGELRPGTRSLFTFVSALSNSSVMPSLRYSSFLSALMFTNGRTAMLFWDPEVGPTSLKLERLSVIACERENNPRREATTAVNPKESENPRTREGSRNRMRLFDCFSFLPPGEFFGHGAGCLARR